MRRPARNQQLPSEEVDTIRSLKGFDLYARSRDLYNAGWTLRAIGEAYDPPKPRTTIKSWIERSLESAPQAALPDVPAPEYITPDPEVKPAPKTIHPSDLARIQQWAPIARKYRSGMNEHHKASIANASLTHLCGILYAEGVSIRQLSEAAGVTYRAMAKRIGRA